MAVLYSRHEIEKMRDACFKQAAFYESLAYYLDSLLLVYSKLFGNSVTQTEDPGAGS